jgi:hypothetical protein
MYRAFCTESIFNITKMVMSVTRKTHVSVSGNLSRRDQIPVNGMASRQNHCLPAANAFLVEFVVILTPGHNYFRADGKHSLHDFAGLPFC